MSDAVQRMCAKRVIPVIRVTPPGADRVRRTVARREVPLYPYPNDSPILAKPARHVRIRDGHTISAIHRADPPPGGAHPLHPYPGE